MRGLILLLLVMVALGGCALEPQLPATGYLPFSTFRNSIVGEDPAIEAMNAATYAFAHPAAMQGHPARMAIAIASLDAMAGQFATGARWVGMNSLARQQMLQARSAVRRIMGIAPGTSSQIVVDALVGAARQIRRGNIAGANLALSSPGFTASPAASLQLLAHFPAVPIANHATNFASQYLYPDGGAFNGFRS